MKSLLLNLVCFIAVIACSTERPKGKTQAEVLFKEANSLVDDGRYILATEKLKSIKKPVSL